MDSVEDKRHWEREKKERFPYLNSDSEKHVTMGTKGFSWNLFGSLQSSGQNPSVSARKRKDHTAQGSSPKSDTTVQAVRQQERSKEEEWKRQREIERSKEWRRERERGLAQGHREREKESVGTAQEREGRYIKSGKVTETKVRRQNKRLASETGKERWREGDIFQQMPETSRERVERLIKSMCREGDGRTKPQERLRGIEREEISDRERKVGHPRDEQRHIQRNRDMERWNDCNTEKEYRKNGGGVRDKEVQLEQCEIRKELSPRYRQRELWEEKELQGERERGRDREREGGRTNQYERSRGQRTAERLRIPETETEKFSDREGWERKRQRHRVTKSDGDGEGDILQRREIDPQRGLQQKHSRSEGDGEEKGRERYTDGWGYKERDKQRGKEQHKAKARYRDMEGRRENDRYIDRLMQTDMERYEGRQRYRGPEKGREGTQSRLVGNWQKYGEKGRDPMKYSREEWEKHHSPGRERCPKKQGDLESKSIDDHWTDTRSRPWGYGSDVDCGKKEKKRQTTQDKRQRPSRMWIDSQKEGLEITEREAIHEQCVDEDIQMPMDEWKFTGGEERVSEWEENEGNGNGAERKPERDREDEYENDKWLGKEMGCDEDLESENDAQNKTLEDIDQNLTEDVIGSTEEGESEVGNVSEECSPSEDEGESARQEKQVERMEDDLAAVSSGGEEEHEETLEDGKEFLQCAATSDEDLQSVEFQNAEQMKKGTEQHERDDGDSTLEGEDESTNELTDMGEDLDFKRNRMDEVQNSKALERKKGDDVDKDDGDGDDEDGGDDGDGDDRNGDDDDKKVTVFFLVGQTLCKNKERQQTEELNTNLGPDNGSVPPLAESQNAFDREKEAKKDIEKSDDESSLGTLCVSKKPYGDENSEIPLEPNNSKDQYLNEDGGCECSENGRIVMSEENESGTEKDTKLRRTESSNEGKRHTEPCLDLPSEPGDGGENKSMFTANRKPDKEPCSEHESDNQRQTEPISQTTDESTCRNNVEQCKEEATPYLKSSVDIITEIPGASEDGPTETPEETPEMDTQDTSDPITNCDNDKSTEECIQIKTHTYSDMVTNNEKEEMKNSEAYVESDPIIVVSVEGENAQVGAGIQITAEDESCKNSETDQICHSPITKRTLSKSDSCPSPVSSPSKSPTSAAKGDAEKRCEMQNEEEDSYYFQHQADEALLRRRMCRKTTDRCKDGEDESGRISSPRVFDVSEDDDKLSLSCGEAELRTISDSLRRPKKKNSRFFNSQLYQEYCEVVQNQEILLQSCSDATSPTLPILTSQLSRRPLPAVPSIPHPHSLYQSNTLPNTSTRSLPLLPPPSRSSSPRFSASCSLSPILWQDLPGVRKSSELSDLNEDERRLQEVRFEVVTSEASYCRSLDIAVDHFVKSKQLAVLLSAQDKNWLFSRLGDVRALSHSFLSRLEEQVEKDVMHFTVCDIIIRYCPRFRLVYVHYLTNQSYQDKTYQRLMEECPGFRRVVETLERSPVCQRLPLRSFLVLPFQRITRLKLLVQNIVKRSVSNTNEEVQAIKALKLLEKLIKESNDSITQMKSIESLVLLSSKVDFGCKTLPLVSQSRRLIREGSVAEMCDFALKETERTVYLHLFNDYLLLSLQKESGRFLVIDYAPTAKIRVENCRVKLHTLQKNVFRLHLTPQRALLLRSDTHSDKLRWMSALSRPHPDIDFTIAQDLIQVQCVKAFVGQQPDEISLEKADVLLVHQQSSDGWVEGTRLSDRQRGWAPEGHLERIVNAKARQRNLLDTQKIKTATATH